LKLDEGRSFLIAGVLLALAALVRPVAQYYFLILFVFALLWPAKNFVIKLKYGVIYALAFVITISPWLYRNYALYDTVKLSSVQGENLLFWQVTYTKAWETHRSTDEISSEFMTEAKASGFVEGSNPFANEAIAQKIGVQYIKTHIQVCVSRLITGMVHTYTNLNTANIFITLGLKPTALPSGAMSASESEFKLISLFFQSKSLAEIVVGLIVMTLLLINYSMFLLGSGVLVKRRQWIILSLFVVSIMYFTATGGPIGLARFRLPIAPFYLLVGAVYIEQFLSRRAL
jgi:4-amino-4-deoxy-L-arabinose transferase-like glycosyltransferase